MKITRLVLSGYKRLMLNNIKRLTITPESVYQLILGTNGSGKSSVLAELTPLPAVTANYVKGGYKEIDLEHRSATYQLVSLFKSGNHHSFKKNGEELNPGGTQTVQRELVEQEFGITQDIHDLLTGSVHFTDLSPQKRREWLTKLCDVDFSYAIGVHQKLKSSARDAQGALKHTKQRLSAESQKLLGIGDLEELEGRYRQLTRELDVLYSERDNNCPDVQRLRSDLDNTMAEIERLTGVLIEKFPTGYQGHSFSSLQNIDEALVACNTDRQVKESLRSRVAAEYQDLSQLVEGFAEAGVEDFGSVETQLADLTQEREQLNNQLEQWTELRVDPVESQRSFYEAGTNIIVALQNLPANPQRRFNPQDLRAAKEALPPISQDVERQRNRVAHLESQLEHLQSLKDQTCPDCGHRWVPGRSDQEVLRLQTAIRDQQLTLVELEKRESELSEYIDGAQTYSQQFYALKQLVHQYPRLQDLWDSLLGAEELVEKPQALVTLVHLFGRDVDRQVSIHALSERIERLLKLISNNGDDDQVTGVKRRLEVLNEDMEGVTQELTRIQEHSQQLSRYRQYLKVYLTHAENLENLLETAVELRDDLIRGLRGSEIEGVIRSHQIQLAGLQSRLTEKQTLEGIIGDLQRDHDVLTVDQEALSLLADTLSPVDGLIAEQLTGFIESFVAHINQVIQSIWTYDLKVVPCGVESGDLDYRFPLSVKHEGMDNLAPDIAKGSEAQVEVVNLAFRLVTMVYLGLDEYPVFLDEVGRSFDEQHRINVMNFIKRLVDTGNYTQLFMISHYVGQYNVFTKAEVLVLDGTNIAVPGHHNTHAVLE